MTWSYRVGRLAGIDLKIHVTFLLILGWVGLRQWQAEGTVSSVVWGVTLILAVFGCVVLHELGHALTARRFGIRTRDIILLPIGGVARLEKMPEKPTQELAVAIAGPWVNVVIAVTLYGGLRLTDHWIPLDRMAIDAGSAAIPMLQQLVLINVALFVFNLIPAFPMDGGRVLRALLAIRLPYAQATRIAASVGQTLAMVFAFLGLFSNPFLIFIALFVWIGAAQEASMVTTEEQIRGVTVGHVMLTDFQVLRATDTLERAVTLTMAGSQVDFPVVEGQRPVGLLTQRALLEALAAAGKSASVAVAMDREVEAIGSKEALQPVLRRMREKRQGALPVLQGNAMVGLLTLENINEFLAIQSALNH